MKNKRAHKINHKAETITRREFKTKIRRSPEWSELRQLKANEQNSIDPITLRPLTHGFNCHHLQCEDWTKYGDLDPEKFVCLNSKSHTTIHFLWEIVKRDGDFDVLERIKEVLKKMKSLNEKSTK